MSDKQLFEQLEQLREAVEAVGPMDNAKRERLLALIADIEAQVDPESGMLERAEAAVAEFDLSHPTLAAVIKRIIETLGNIGV